MSSYVFNTREKLDTAIDIWITDKSAAKEIYGDINTWDVSTISNFSHLFARYNDSGELVQSLFNDDISN